MTLGLNVKKYKLEDCPWCESAKKLDFDTRQFGCMDPFVFCNRCGARGCYATSKEIAAKRWNDVMGMVKRYNDKEDEILGRMAEKAEKEGYIGIEESKKLEDDILNSKEES